MYVPILSNVCLLNAFSHVLAPSGCQLTGDRLAGGQTRSREGNAQVAFTRTDVIRRECSYICRRVSGAPSIQLPVRVKRHLLRWLYDVRSGICRSSSV